MNYFNYFKHSVFTPQTYHRRYDHDLQKETAEGSAFDLVKRVALSALPFVALYRPAGIVLSVGMGSCRVCSHLSEALSGEQNGSWGRASTQLTLAVVAAGSVASSLFHFGVGLAVSTLMDTSQGLWHTIESGWQGNYDKAFEELLQTLSSSLYLGFMATGTLEIILLSTVIQGLTCLYQARQEIAKGHYIEAGAKVLLSGTRGYQAVQYKQLINKRDFLFSIKKYQDLAFRALNGRQVRHLVQHDLGDLDGKIEEKRVLLSSQDHDYDFGSHFHGYGKGIVKGANLTFRTVVVDGKQMTELEFKVNHVARETLEKTVEDLSHLGGKETRELLALTQSHATDLSVNRKGSCSGFCFGKGEAPTTQITLGGLGSVSIGASEGKGGQFNSFFMTIPNLYDKVVVRMDPGKTLYDFHELMAFLDLEGALCVSSSEDLERLKLGHLFRTFFPREALPLERNEVFFTSSLPELKKTMIEKVPEMEKVYNTYFHRMSPTDIVPGRVRYRIEGLAAEVKACGFSCLTTAVTGPQDDDTLFSRVASMLKMGMVATELRDTYHVNAEGLGNFVGYLFGGADEVFTQLMPKEFEEGKRSLREFSTYRSRVRFRISLDALESGTYQYKGDAAGNRGSHWLDTDNGGYAQRLGTVEFAKALQQESEKGGWAPLRQHEVMIKERLPPNYFEGMWVEDEKTKQGLLDYLRLQDLVKVGPTGQETILDTPIEQFVRVRGLYDEKSVS